MNKYRALTAIFVAGLCLPASAQFVEEVRFGVAQHNICVVSEDIFDCDNADKEDGVNVTVELVFASPDFLSWAFEPRPFVTGSLNTAGDTSYVGGGLMWTIKFADRWAFEPSFAYAVHDGASQNPFPLSTPENAAFSANNVLFGSDDLFRTGLALSRQMGENWGIQLQYDHLSHGEILGDEPNQGLDNFGVRVYWQFQ